MVVGASSVVPVGSAEDLVVSSTEEGEEKDEDEAGSSVKVTDGAPRRAVQLRRVKGCRGSRRRRFRFRPRARLFLRSQLIYCPLHIAEKDELRLTQLGTVH